MLATHKTIAGSGSLRSPESQSAFRRCILDLLWDRLVFLVEEFNQVEKSELDFFSYCDIDKKVDDGFIY
jgi:hypothetical protein